MTSGCAHPGRVWVCGRSAGRSDSYASKEPPSRAWPDNWQPRGTPCGPISSRVCKPHLMTPPASQGFGYPGSMRGVWHHHDRRRRGPRAHWHRGPDSRGGSSYGLLEWTWCRAGLAPCTRTGPSAEKTCPRGRESRRSIPFQGLQECHCLACSKDATSVRGACHIVTLAGDAPGEVRRRVQQDTTGHRGRKGGSPLSNPQSFARLA